MKVALFVDRFPVTSETFVLRQAIGLLRAGIDLTIIALRPGDPWTDAANGALFAGRVTVLHPTPATGSALLRGLARLAARAAIDGQARRALRAGLGAARAGQRTGVKDILAAVPRRSLGRYDAILAHFGPFGVRAAHLRRAGLLHGPIATVFHGYDMSVAHVVASQQAAYAMLFRETELLLPISDFWRDRLIAWGAPREKIVVHRMGVDVDPTVELSAERPIGRPLRVLSVGRFTEKKGLRYAIEGARGAVHDVRLRIIGYGEGEAELRACAAGGHKERIAFLGAMPHAAVLAEVAQADVFLLPSVVAANGDMEGIPVAIMEAMVQGAIVIATRHSGIPELVTDGVSGLLVDERSPEQIATALDQVAGGGVDAVAMRRAAYATVLARFDNATLDPGLIDLLVRLAATA